jgi:alcohol dehydrogenase class IV
MVKAFQFVKTPKIIFANNGINNIPKIIKGFGKKILLVTGKGSFLKSQHAERLFSGFDSNEILYEKVNIYNEPSPDLVDAIVSKYSNTGIDLVLAIGGGSSLDAGKAVSAMLNKQESVKEYLEGIGRLEHSGKKVPFIAVPTTSGTGSEATKNAVLSNVGKCGFKRSLRHDNLVPDIAVIDPELIINCPPKITATSGMDCFTQLVEAYLSSKSGLLSDALAFEGIRKIKTSLVQCYLNGDDIDARSGMAFAALMSGICINNAGLGTVHGFASSIGGFFPVPHGVVCGTLMATSNDITVRELRKISPSSVTLQKYASLGELFTDKKEQKNDYYIDSFIDFLYKLTEELNIPKLSEFGITKDDLEMICNATENKNNPLNLYGENLLEILNNRI